MGVGIRRQLPVFESAWEPGAAKRLSIDAAADRYTLTAGELESARVSLNGRELRLGANDAMPALRGVRVKTGEVEFAPASITFLAAENANNESRR